MKNSLKLLTLLAICVLLGCTDKNIVSVPVFPPSQVENFTVTPGDSEVTLVWSINDNEIITGYEIRYSPEGGNPILLNNDISKYVVTSLINDTEYTFSLFAKNGTQSSEATIITATPKEINLSGPELSSFTFAASTNRDMALDSADIIDLKGIIDQDNNTVTFDAENISAYIYLDALVPTLDVPEGATVTVDEETHISEETAQDFTRAVQYKITLDGKTRVYTVTIEKNQFATIPDAAFVTKLKDLGLPFNEDNQLDAFSSKVVNYESTSKLDVDGAGITDIKGIEFFVNVKEIDAENNTFPSINISRNTGLKNLVIGSNSEIATINLGDKTDIEIIYINDTPKLNKTIMQPILDANASSLKRFYAHGTTGLTSVDVSNLIVIERLRLDESTARASAASINTLLAKNPPIASNLKDLRVYSNGEKCESYNSETYECD